MVVFKFTRIRICVTIRGMNTQTQTASKVLRMSIITSICATLATPLILTSSLYFPYITGKAFFMRTFILIAAVLYAVLISVDKVYRPRVSALMYAVMGFMLVLIASWMHSVAPDRSFWSNFERMEGLVTLLYMAVLFVVSSSTIRKREWTWVMNISLAISVLVGIAAIGDFSKGAAGEVIRLSGTLGNSSYLGVYALIHIFFAILALLMIYRGKREEVLLASGTHESSARLPQSAYIYMIVYAILAVFNGYILFYTGTRGSFVGLVGGLLLTSGYLAWKERNKILRYGSMGVLAGVFIAVVLLGTFKHTTLVQESPLLSRFAAILTTDVKGVLANQGQARTILWKMAYQGVQEKPLLGWGQDTFGYVFAKYYNPGMYGQEQWFDRSHNVFFDWLISAGVLGLLGYLLLFVFALVCIFSKKAKLTVIEKSVLIGLLAAYFIHNLFVFDNLSSYVLFFILLGYIHERYTHDRVHVSTPARVKGDDDMDEGSILIGAAFFALLIASYIGYKTIYEPYTQNTTLIEAMMMAGDQKKVTTDMLPRMKKVPMDVAYDDFVKIFTLGHTGETESYEQLMSVAVAALTSNTVSDATKRNLLDLYQTRLAYHGTKNAQDPRFAYFASNFYLKLNAEDQALEYALKAYNLSPNKQSFAYGVAVLELRKGDTTSALAYLKKAYEDAPQNPDAFTYYVSVLVEDAKINGGKTFSAVKLGSIAQVLADGYTQHQQPLLVDPKLWETFTKTGKIREGKILSTRLEELVPEKKADIEKAIAQSK